jgi:hypothetical protein
VVVPASIHENRTTGLMLEHLRKCGDERRLSTVVIGEVGCPGGARIAARGPRDRSRRIDAAADWFDKPSIDKSVSGAAPLSAAYTHEREQNLRH